MSSFRFPIEAESRPRCVEHYLADECRRYVLIPKIDSRCALPPRILRQRGLGGKLPLSSVVPSPLHFYLFCHASAPLCTLFFCHYVACLIYDARFGGAVNIHDTFLGFREKGDSLHRLQSAKFLRGSPVSRGSQDHFMYGHTLQGHGGLHRRYELRVYNG